MNDEIALPARPLGLSFSSFAGFVVLDHRLTPASVSRLQDAAKWSSCALSGTLCPAYACASLFFSLNPSSGGLFTCHFEPVACTSTVSRQYIHLPKVRLTRGCLSFRESQRRMDRDDSCHLQCFSLLCRRSSTSTSHCVRERVSVSHDKHPCMKMTTCGKDELWSTALC